MASILNWRSEELVRNADRIGKLIETFVYSQAASLVDLNDDYRLYHYRDRLQREIDFIVERQSDGAILAVAVKAALSVNRKDFHHIRWFAEHMAMGRPFTGIVLYAGAEVFSFGEGIQAVPLSAMWAQQPGKT